RRRQPAAARVQWHRKGVCPVTARSGGSSAKPRRVALCILDGLGLSYRKRANAFALANTPVLDDLLARYPFTTLAASGEAVGLQDGQMGDSNVGHLNLGAGRIIYQELVRIDRAIATGVF